MEYNFEYQPDSFSGDFDDASFESWKRYYFGPKSIIGGKGFQIDHGWLAHLRKYHGGRPESCIATTVNENSHPIDRFLNFSSPNHPLETYHVGCIWADMGERLSELHVPFAITSFGDVVCFDYGQVTDGRPAVVMWYHEKSRDFDPYTEYIAPNFDEFMNLLRPSEYDENDT